MIKVIICDDQDLVCDGLEAIFSTIEDIQVVGIANDGAEALEYAEKITPDVVLMDLKMRGMNGVEATYQFSQQFPQTHVLILTTFADDSWLFDAIRSGARGYLLKDTPRDEIIAAVRGVADGKSYIDPEVAGKLLDHISQKVPSPDSHILSTLSDREREILGCIGRGLANGDIAEHLCLTVGTVRNYVSNIFQKLDVSDRTQAAILAVRFGLVD